MPHELDVVSYREGYGRGFDEALKLVERYGFVFNAPRMVINGAGYDTWHPEDEFPKKITITENQLDIEKTYGGANCGGSHQGKVLHHVSKPLLRPNGPTNRLW